MEEHATWVSEAVNSLAAMVAGMLGYPIPAGHGIIPQPVVMALVVMIILLALSLYLRRNLSVDQPGGLQQSIELFFEIIQSLMRDMIGPHSERYFPLIAGLGLFILTSNWLGMVPGFVSPTANLNCTVALAVCSFFYYNYQGVRSQGVLPYLKHLCGPVIWLAPLLFAIEIVSHLARPFSLSVRLFGNIYAEEMIVNTLNNSIFPFFTSLPVMFLALLLSTIQAGIFMVLSMVYIGGAVEESHH